MKTAGREIVYNTHDKNNAPTLRVADGETFRVLTELNGGTWLKSDKDQWRPGKSQGPNLSACIYVEGAEAGDTLAVDIIDVTPGELGYTGFAGWRLPLSQEIIPNDWDVVTKTVRIEDGFVLWSDALKLPVRPMIGTLGTAPAGEPMSNQFAGHTGGNMDIQEVRAGTTVYLPAEVTGALLHVGDGHAVMGDGEINHGGGIECRCGVTLRCRVIKGRVSREWIRMEDGEYIMAAACGPDMRGSFCAAVRELIAFMTDYGFDEREAYLLLGEEMEARCTLPFNNSYICKIKKEFLKPDKDFRPMIPEVWI